MNSPMLTFGSTVIGLPLPQNAVQYNRDYKEQRVDRYTLAGYLRTGVLSKSYVYTLGYRFKDRNLYAWLATQWEAMVNAQTFPTFDWQDEWPSANGIPVSLTIGAMEHSHDPQLVHFNLILAEVNPR